MITFVDYYATSFIAFVPAMFQLIAVFYVYGTEFFIRIGEEIFFQNTVNLTVILIP